MHIFRHQPVWTTAAALLRGIERAAARPSPLDLLLACAQLENAVVDAGSPGCDGCDPRCAPLLDLCIGAAQHLRGGRARPWVPMAGSLRALLPPPETVLQAGEAEGFRFYGLHPAAYERAAEAWCARAAPPPVLVIGLRSMGTALAAYVIASLRSRLPAGHPVEGLTLRPRGDPQERTVRLTPQLAQRLAAWRGECIIVDEGPGQSGSSFGGTVRALRELGIGAERICLMPSWLARGAQLTSRYAAGHWDSWRVLPAAPPAPPAPGVRDISAGAWRRALGRGPRVPVWPQHERLKFLSADGRVIWKFAGYGPAGRAVHARAEALAAAGFGPPVLAESGAGWVAYERLRTRQGRGGGADWVEFTARYLAWVETHYTLERAAPPAAALTEMVAINLSRLGAGAPGPAPPIGPVVALDGRMLAVEWGRTPAGWVKFDATDHGDDPFFPGPTDVAWDLAALDVEFGARWGTAVAQRYCQLRGVGMAALTPRLAWHRVAYLAFRAAFCHLAATQVAAPDATGFRVAADRYGAALPGCRQHSSGYCPAAATDGSWLGR